MVDLWIRELRRQGHTVALLARHDSTAVVDAFFPWPGAKSQNRHDTARNSLALWLAARRFRADVVHSSSRLIYTLPLLSSRRPVVMTYHRQPGVRQIAIAARMGQRRLAFTGVSEYITALGRKGGGHWHTVHNCINLAALSFVPEVSPTAPLVFLSRIEKVKGAREAIQMARKAGLPLVLAGNHSADASAAHYWRDTIEPLVDGTHVRYVGAVNDTQKNILLGGARALLVPVQWDEPFGLVFAEALACGTPVIATPRGALPEIIRHGRNGFLVTNETEASAAIDALPSIDRPECRRDAEARFSPGVAIEHFVRIYRSVCQ